MFSGQCGHLCCECWSCWAVFIVLCWIVWKFVLEMADEIKSVISTYQRRLMEVPYVPKTSYGRASLGDDGEANKLFLMFLSSDMDIGIQFLKEVGLLRSKMPCNTCGRDLTWCAEPKPKDGFRWRCRRKAALVWSERKSIRHGSWFRQSKLTLQEVMYLTYDIVSRVPAHITHKEHRFSLNTIAQWGLLCGETMLVYMEGCSEKIGVLTRPSRSTKASSVGANIIGATLLWGSGCLAVLSASPGKRFSFGPLTL